MSDETHAAVERAIADHLADEAGRESPIVTKWIVAAEIVSNTKEYQELVTVSAEGMSTWDVAGMCGLVEHRCKHWFATSGDDEGGDE